MKFILTKELGRLAKWLRILGYDAVYYDKDDRSKLIILSLREGRIVLTRDSKLSKFTGIRMIRIADNEVKKQLEQVFKELGPSLTEKDTFTRCVECNEMLSDIQKDSVKDKVPPYVFKHETRFKKCNSCGKIFWNGTHLDLVKNFLEKK
ncbi:MAG: Mut7-C RNAse domain-containing protein [Candidatus Omnitrophica bacterium]|nr:Mut7-C RNAse domain-containing protein [Candidatus Omnitrophota bacterium]